MGGHSHSGSSGGHSHGASASVSNKGARCRLLFMLSLTTSFFLIEITVGYITNSMALVADSFHMLSDVIALVIAYVSVRMSPKKWSKNTFGWARAEVLGALVNAVFLCALCFSILVESVKRFYKPETIHDPPLILVVGVSGLLVNVIGLFLFKDSGGHGHSHGGGGGGGHGHSHSAGGGAGGHSHSGSPSPQLGHGGNHHHHLPSGDDGSASFRGVMGDGTPSTPSPEPGDTSSNHSKSNDQITKSSNNQNNGQSSSGKSAPQPTSSQQLNMRGVFLHVLADALGSVIVCASACIFIFTDFRYKDYVDPTLSVLMVCLILYSTWGLLIESAMILLQTVPTHIQVDSLQRKLLQEIDGVLAVHEFHVWQLAGDRIIASAHIRCHNLHDYMQIAEKVKEFFHNEGIHSTTIQPEFVDLEDNEQYKIKSDGGTDGSSDCVLDCPKKPSGNCVQQTCCGPQQGSGGKDSPNRLNIIMDSNGLSSYNNSNSNSPNLSSSKRNLTSDSPSPHPPVAPSDFVELSISGSSPDPLVQHQHHSVPSSLHKSNSSTCCAKRNQEEMV